VNVITTTANLAGDTQVTDDIVTRLRIESASSVDVIRRLDMKCLCCPCCEESCLYCETVGELTEAADEIERLRKELSETQTQLAYWREIALENQTNG